MTKEELETKLEGLRAQEQQAIANLNATRGARQFCEHLIAEIAKKAEEAEQA
jgi:hypothetical protein